MKKLLALIFAIVLEATSAPAQDVAHSYTKPGGPDVGSATDMVRVFTHPKVPTTAVLDRLNMKLGWRIYLPTDGRRDGLFTIQLAENQIFIQARSGAVTALNAEDGNTLWRAWPGNPYHVSLPLAYNSHSIFAIRGVTLYSLDRQTGHTQWWYNLPEGVSAAPAADEEKIYLGIGTGRFVVFQLPKPGEFTGTAVSGAVNLSSGPYAEVGSSTTHSGPLPIILYDYLPTGRLERKPILSQNLAFLAATDGTFFAMSKEQRNVLYRFKADAPVAAPLGQYGDIAYVASLDFNVYATDILAGKILWRFTGAAPMLLQPAATDEDLYLTPVRGGLYRLERLTGNQLWRNPDAVRFLAANRKFVYAQDRSSRLLILDRARGTQLAIFDSRDYVVPVTNELTDRLYLAANDGLIVCLFDKDYPEPLQYQKPPELKPIEGKTTPKGAPKAEEKPKEEDKENK